MFTSTAKIFQPVCKWIQFVSKMYYKMAGCDLKQLRMGNIVLIVYYNILQYLKKMLHTGYDLKFKGWGGWR